MTASAKFFRMSEKLVTIENILNDLKTCPMSSHYQDQLRKIILGLRLLSGDTLTDIEIRQISKTCADAPPNSSPPNRWEFEEGYIDKVLIWVQQYFQVCKGDSHAVLGQMPQISLVSFPQLSLPTSGSPVYPSSSQGFTPSPMFPSSSQGFTPSPVFPPPPQGFTPSPMFPSSSSQGFTPSPVFPPPPRGFSPSPVYPSSSQGFSPSPVYSSSSQGFSPSPVFPSPPQGFSPSPGFSSPQGYGVGNKRPFSVYRSSSATI